MRFEILAQRRTVFRAAFGTAYRIYMESRANLKICKNVGSKSDNRRVSVSACGAEHFHSELVKLTASSRLRLLITEKWSHVVKL